MKDICVKKVLLLSIFCIGFLISCTKEKVGNNAGGAQNTKEGGLISGGGDRFASSYSEFQNTLLTSKTKASNFFKLILSTSPDLIPNSIRTETELLRNTIIKRSTESGSWLNEFPMLVQSPNPQPHPMYSSFFIDHLNNKTPIWISDDDCVGNNNHTDASIADHSLYSPICFSYKRLKFLKGEDLEQELTGLLIHEYLHAFGFNEQMAYLIQSFAVQNYSKLDNSSMVAPRTSGSYATDEELFLKRTLKSFLWRNTEDTWELCDLSKSIKTLQTLQRTRSYSFTNKPNSLSLISNFSLYKNHYSLSWVRGFIDLCQERKLAPLTETELSRVQENATTSLKSLEKVIENRKKTEQQWVYNKSFHFTDIKEIILFHKVLLSEYIHELNNLSIAKSTQSKIHSKFLTEIDQLSIPVKEELISVYRAQWFYFKILNIKILFELAPNCSTNSNINELFFCKDLSKKMSLQHLLIETSQKVFIYLQNYFGLTDQERDELYDLYMNPSTLHYNSVFAKSIRKEAELVYKAVIESTATNLLELQFVMDTPYSSSLIPHSEFVFTTENYSTYIQRWNYFYSMYGLRSAFIKDSIISKLNPGFSAIQKLFIEDSGTALPQSLSKEQYENQIKPQVLEYLKSQYLVF